MPVYSCVVIAACLCTACTEKLANDPLQRETSFGTVEGYSDEECELWIWKGIPFAKPPIGDLRWRAPLDPEPWEGIRAATEHPAACIQPKLAPPLTILPEATGSEDCLYLNIYRPQTDEENLPVYFWIHGGGNVFGSATGWYVQDLARKANLVLVEVQYRLGLFGYFTHPAFRSGGQTPDDSGNFGTLDQIKALEWVRDNIAAFGGNPYNVTIGGHSAGGHNVAQLKISPLAHGLFHRAVIQSDSWLAQSVADIDRTANRTIENALTTKGLAKDLKDARRIRSGMTDTELIAFLRSVPACDLLKSHLSGQGNPVWSFVIEDGLVIPGPLYRVVESGRYARVPTIIGATETESGFAHMTACPPYAGMPDYRDLAQVVEGKKNLEEVLPTQKDKQYWTKARHYGSLFIRAMRDEHAKRLAIQGDHVYAFSFNWGSERVCSEIHAFTFGAAHCMEMPFIFGNVNKKEDWLKTTSMYRSFTATNRPGRLALSDAMVSYLSQFVRTGNPNNALSGLPEWKPWSSHAGGHKVLQLDADLEHAQISMDTRELSVAGIRHTLDAEPADLRKHVLAMVSFVQPFMAYEPGDYEFGSE